MAGLIESIFALRGKARGFQQQAFNKVLGIERPQTREETLPGRQQAVAGLIRADPKLNAIVAAAGPQGVEQIAEPLVSADPSTRAIGGATLETFAEQTAPGGKLGIPSPKDFTIQSLGNFEQSGDVNDLVRYTDPLAVGRQNLNEDRLDMQRFLSTRPSNTQIDKFVNDTRSLDQLTNLQRRALPDFFGSVFTTVGKAQQEFSRRFGDEAAQGYNRWWQSYNFWVQDIRKEMFGSQFTPSEQKIFLGLVVNPAVSAATAMANLQEQRDMVRQGMRSRSSVLEDLGFEVPTSLSNPADELLNEPGRQVEPRPDFIF